VLDGRTVANRAVRIRGQSSHCSSTGLQEWSSALRESTPRALLPAREFGDEFGDSLPIIRATDGLRGRMPTASAMPPPCATSGTSRTVCCSSCCILPRNPPSVPGFHPCFRKVRFGGSANAGGLSTRFGRYWRDRGQGAIGSRERGQEETSASSAVSPAMLRILPMKQARLADSSPSFPALDRCGRLRQPPTAGQLGLLRELPNRVERWFHAPYGNSHPFSSRPRASRLRVAPPPPLSRELFSKPNGINADNSQKLRISQLSTRPSTPPARVVRLGCRGGA
jgi:hypothetical protein